MTMTLEEKAAQVILQEEQEINIAGETYHVHPPTLATLIKASELISRLPNRKMDIENIVGDSLEIAKHCRLLGNVLSVFILGVEEYKLPIKQKYFDRIYQFIFGCRPKETKGEILANKILLSMSPTEFNHTLTMVLSRMELSDFFAVTTFLCEVNILRETKVETEATALGQSWQGQ